MIMHETQNCFSLLRGPKNKFIKKNNNNNNNLKIDIYMLQRQYYNTAKTEATKSSLKLRARVNSSDETFPELNT